MIDRQAPPPEPAPPDAAVKPEPAARLESAAEPGEPREAAAEGAGALPREPRPTAADRAEAQPPSPGSAEPGEASEGPATSRAAPPPARSIEPKEAPRELARGPEAAVEGLAPEPIPDRVPAPPAEDPDLEEIEAATIDQPPDEESDTPFDKLAARARKLSPERIRAILEALLFVTDKPLTEEAIRACTGLELAVVREGLQQLQGTYRDGVCGIVLHEVAGGWQFRTDPGCAEYVRRFLKVKPQRLTRAALETLAIVAYRQPVTRPEIEEIRAVDSGAVLKALLERRLLKIIGKKDEPGRPLLYGTTKEFLEFFNLRDLGSLPTLREFQELTEENREVVERETGPSPAQSVKSLVADLRDDRFAERLAQTKAEADEALANLEAAMADSDAKARQAAQVLRPQAPDAPQAGTPEPEPSSGPPEDQD